MINLCLLQENYTILYVCLSTVLHKMEPGFAIYLAHNVRDDAEVFILSLDWARTCWQMANEQGDQY